jgi:hypothetical protein
MEKPRFKEGHGFSRAAGVRCEMRLQPLRYGFLRNFVLNHEKAVPQGLKPTLADTQCGTAKAVPFLETRLFHL